MAAMAQQDCGQCGYNCADYSERSRKRRNGSISASGRQGNRADAEAARGRDRTRRRRRPTGLQPCRAAPAQPQSPAAPARIRSRHVHLAPQAQRGGFGKGHLAHRIRSRRAPASIMSPVIPSAFFPQRSRPRRSDHRLLGARIPASQRQDLARGPARGCLAVTAPDSCSNSSPTSPAPRSAKRHVPWRGAKIPMAMPRRST